MNKKIVSGSAIAVAVAALLLGGATPASARKPTQASKAKTAKASESPEKHRCNANGCPTK
jgi:Flp pilus assembly protein TadD